MRFTKKEVLVRGILTLVIVLLLGYLLFNFNWWKFLLVVLGAAAWDTILFVLFRYDIITWKKWKG